MTPHRRHERCPPAAALVRRPARHLAEAELTHLARQPVDPDRAASQHTAYVEVLRQYGVAVRHLPAAPSHPDGVFVEDVVVAVGGLAIVTRPGAASRRGETAGLEPILAAMGLEVVTVEPPATLDGGDVLQIGTCVYVGRSSRTNDAAVEQLRRWLVPLGRTVVPVDVTGALHLKTAVTALPDGELVARPDCVDLAPFGPRPILVAPEPTGADVLLLDDLVVVSASAPRTAEEIAGRGFEVVAVAIDELEKLEAGPTCLSVLLTDAQPT
ncbi:dimethylarginine dimethylaminohydrolase family protein [Egicoccus sp. AB-alg2]|uniref:dimethylarginine dimethylaminohydrolase family protein n=1 Tax=Egicoccus sp. AB-alg2 TaxID=3242693 RepID=UPI00359EE234